MVTDKESRDAALQVASSSFRDALTEPIYENGVAGPSIAELCGVEITEDMRNFQLQDAIATTIKRWLVPQSHRPTCPSGKPCTSWTCLVDVCELNPGAAPNQAAETPKCGTCGADLPLTIDMSRVNAGIGGPRPKYVCTQPHDVLPSNSDKDN